MARIAFFTLNAYDMLTGGHEGDAVGGAQLQQILIGKELSSRGHEIYFVEYEDEYKSERCVDGIQIKTKPNPTGSEFTRALTVVQGTREILDRIDPDVCYRRSLDFEIIPLSVFGNLTDTRFVYGVAHDDELTTSPHKFSDGLKQTGLYGWLNRQALSAASDVIVQNSTQSALANERLRTSVHEIPNCYVGEYADPIDWEFEPPVVFWAARFTEWKQPEVVLELARSLPDVTFVMAGAAGDEQLFQKCINQAAEIDNIELLGHVPFAEIDRYFAAADLFLNTSRAEGFPNTFLQAWANKTPVVSLRVNPSHVLTDNGIGVVADGSTIRLRDQIAELVTDTDRITELGERSHQYRENNHSVDAISDKYEQVFVPAEVTD